MMRVATISLLLWVGTSVQAQSPADFPARLQANLIRYYETNPQGKIHLTFNQDRYVAGDTVLFKIWYFSAPSAGRRIVNIYLLNESGNQLFSSKVVVANGAAANQIPLPVEADPGLYTVIACLQGSAFTCRFPLLISGPKLISPEKRAEVSFHPEGGSLVAGITNKVVVRGVPKSSGKVFAGEKEVTEFVLDEDGFGLFFLSPQAGDDCYAIMDIGKVPLPDVRADGAGLIVNVPNRGTPIRVTVQIPEESALKSEELSITLTRDSRVCYAAPIKFNGGRNYFNVSFPQTGIGEGVSRITVFRHDGTAIAERLVYIRDRRPVAKIIVPRSRYNVREMIPITISVRSEDNEPIDGHMALTVFREEEPGDSFPESISLTDNARGMGDLLTPGFTLDSLTRDKYLSSGSWSRYTWEDVFSESRSRPPQAEYLNLKGRLIKADGGQLPDSTVITFLFQRTVVTYVMHVGRDGTFDFPLLLDFYGDEEVYFRAESSGRVVPDVEMALDADPHLNIDPMPHRRTSTDDRYFSFAGKRAEINRSYRYHLETRVDYNPPSLNALIEEEVLGADLVVNLDDYYLFPTMSETLREVVDILQHRRQRGRDVVRLFFDDRNRFAEGEPLFVIDGVITDNVLYFLSLKPSDVATIKVIHKEGKLKTFGSIGSNGIVLVETKIPGNQSLVPRAPQTFRVKGVQHPSPIHNRQTGQRRPRVPDLRTNLYWNPSISTGPSGEITIEVPASDVTGTFKVRVDGLTSDYQPLSIEEEFEVTFME